MTASGGVPTGPVFGSQATDNAAWADIAAAARRAGCDAELAEEVAAEVGPVVARQVDRLTASTPIPTGEAGGVLGEEARESIKLAYDVWSEGGVRTDAQLAEYVVAGLAPHVASLVAAAEQRGAEKEQPEPGAVLSWPEPPVGTVLKDRDDDEWERVDPTGWRCSQWAPDDEDRAPWLRSHGWDGVTSYAPLTVVQWGSR